MKLLHYAAAGAVASAALGSAVPAIAQKEGPRFDEAQFRLDMQPFVRPNEAVLELKTAFQRGGSVVLELDRGTRALFRDDGRGMDEEAGDRTFTGVVPADINRERAIFHRVTQGLRRDVPISIFEGRQLVDRVRSSRLLKKVRPGVMPIFTASAGVSTVVEADKSLFITNPDVLNTGVHSYNPCTHTGDLNGAWSFAHVWTELAGTNDPEVMAADWVNSWDSPQSANGFTASPRPLTRDELFTAWDTDEFGVTDGVLAMEDCPFHPIAITLRVDLRESTGYASGNAGEARIIYSFVGDSCTSSSQGFLAIFEYAINKSGCDVKDWGQRWADLSDFNLSDAVQLAAYQDALAELTREFTDLTTAPMGNELGQLRTNEFISSPWQMREFVLNGAGSLENVTVKLTPDNGFNQTSTVADIVNSMVSGSGCVPPDPLILDPTVGVVADVPFPPSGFFWNDVTSANQPFTAILNNDCRHDFSLNTCNGCHGGETDTFFTHVRWTTPGNAAPLSGFVTGITVNDPVDGTARIFNEMERRREDLQSLIDNSCFGGLIHHAVRSH